MDEMEGVVPQRDRWEENRGVVVSKRDQREIGRGGKRERERERESHGPRRGIGGKMIGE